MLIIGVYLVRLAVFRESIDDKRRLVVIGFGYSLCLGVCLTADVSWEPREFRAFFSLAYWIVNLVVGAGDCCLLCWVVGTISLYSIFIGDVMFRMGSGEMLVVLFVAMLFLGPSQIKVLVKRWQETMKVLKQTAQQVVDEVDENPS